MVPSRRRHESKQRHGGGSRSNTAHPHPRRRQHAPRPPFKPDVSYPQNRPAPTDGAGMTGSAPAELGVGVLEMTGRGCGFLRSSARNYAIQPSDPFVPEALVKRFHLQAGLLISGQVENSPKGDGLRLRDIQTIEGEDPAAYKPRAFDDLTPIDPHDWISLATGAEPLTTRVMDLFTPIGKGQRGLIVAPPRTGKTILLQHTALAVAKKHADMTIIMLLIDERPEEVTDMRRTVGASRPSMPPEIFASTSDRDAREHIRLAELVIERAKRLAEQGKQVFVLLDSLTRLARAYNKNTGSGGRTMSGGIDTRAMEIPKRLFGAARVFEEGGSLTVLGTALVETGSRMDDIIFEEFKGTGNMELVLDRKLADRRIFPAIDINQSGTRKEERLLPPEMLKRVTLLRKSLADQKPVAAMESLVKVLEKHPTNEAFLDRVGTFVR